MLAILIINVYFGQLGESWLETKKVLHYNNKLYISKTFRVNLIEKNYIDPLAKHFGVEKTLEFLIRKYYWPKIRADIEKYI